ncbi:hypothetical protein KM043_016548 [Ampulex compressa]|nr:hypothetical protein KM043_016548 [Ampulex compressa]
MSCQCFERRRRGATRSEKGAEIGSVIAGNHKCPISRWNAIPSMLRQEKSIQQLYSRELCYQQTDTAVGPHASP